MSLPPSQRLSRPTSLPSEATPNDHVLVAKAVQLLRRRYRGSRHTVAAAVRTRSGAVYLGVNLEGIHTPCAEPVALGAALTAGDRAIEAVVAVCKRGRTYPVLAPCGTCRQLLFDYAPQAYFLVPGPRGPLCRLACGASLPSAYRTRRSRTDDQRVRGPMRLSGFEPE